MLRPILSVLANGIVVYALGVVTSVVSTRLLGPEHRGTVVVVLVISSLVPSLAHMGLPSALIYNLSREGDPQRSLGDAIGVFRRLLPIVGAVLLASYAVVWILMRTGVLKGMTPGLIALSVLFSVSVLALTIVTSALTGLQDFRWRNHIGVLSSSITVVLLVGVWIARRPLLPSTFISMCLLANIAGLGLGAVYLMVRYRPRVPKQLAGTRVREYISYGLKVQGSLVAQTLNYRLDTLMLNAYLGNHSVGLYSVGVATAEMLLLIPNSVALVLFPSAAAATEQEQDRMAALTLGSSIYLVAGAAVLWSVLVPWLIPVLYDSEFAASTAVCHRLLPGMVALTALKVVVSLLSAKGLPQHQTHAILVGLLATVALNAVLIPRFGILGAAWASTLAYSCAAAVSVVLYARVSVMPATQWALASLSMPLSRLFRRWSQQHVQI